MDCRSRFISPMTQSQLIQHISAFDKYIKVVKLRSEIKAQSFSLRELVDLTFYPDKVIAIKAARLLERVLLKFPQIYCEDIGYFFEQAGNVKSQSVKRFYAKIIMFITSPEIPKDVRNKVKKINLERVVEICFDWMVDPIMLISVRAASSEALFNLRHRYPWIAEELSKQLEYIIRDTTPAMLTKADMILSYLHCED
jgi:hypothetical protein